MLRLAFDFIITWRETRTRPNAYLYRKYSPKGCSAYHPRMLLQILVYAFA